MQLITLPCLSNDDLRWEKLLQKIEPSKPIIWEFELGLNAPYFPIEDEMVFSSLKLALSFFTKELWPLYQAQTSHGILYRGSADFSLLFQWTSRQEENWEKWKEERPPSSDPHLRRLFCRDVFVHYFQMLSHALPDELPLELCFESTGRGSFAESVQLLSQERFEHFRVSKTEEAIAKLHDCGKSMILGSFAKDGQSPSERIDGGLPKRAGEEMRLQNRPKGRFYASKSFAIASEKEASFAVCFPTEMKCSGQVLFRLDQLFEGLKIPYRIIEEAYLTESWEGVDLLYVLSEGVTPIGKRKLMGFCAAGGTVIVEGESLGLSREMKAEEFRGRGI